MNPILYQATESNFNHNGLGMLSDCTYCVVTEERNGIFELEIRYPITGQLYDEIKYDSIIKAKSNEISDLQLFRVYYNSKPINGEVTFKAEHISYQLSRIPVSPFTSDSAVGALTEMQSKSAIENPFSIWTDVSKQGTMTVDTPTSFRSLLGGIQGSVLDVFGGEYEFDNYTVKLHNNRGQDRGVKILYGKNLKDIQQEENIENALTGLYPYCKDTDGNLIELPEKVIVIQSTYAYPRVAPIDLSDRFNNDVPVTVDMLREAANRYIQNNDIDKPTVSIQVEFEPLWQTAGYEDIAGLERVGLCDTVEVEFYKLGISTKAKVVKTIYDVLKEKYEKIEIGDARTNLADTIVTQQKEMNNAPTMSVLERAIAAATNAIVGNSGGYVVLRPAKNPQEILIMDTPDINTAKNVWRWNSGGLGHSSNGYNGPYSLAMTGDGQIVADKITTGVLNANIIKAGILSSVDNNVYFDLDSGTLSASQLTAKTSTGNAYLELAKAGSSVSYNFVTDGHVGLSIMNNYRGFSLCPYEYGWNNGDVSIMVNRDSGISLTHSLLNQPMASIIISSGKVDILGQLYVNGREVATT